jgi:acetyl esterase
MLRCYQPASSHNSGNLAEDRIDGRSTREGAGESGRFRHRSGATESRGVERAGLVFFHAGGFVAGDPASHDSFCGQLSVSSGCAIVACSYRLAPEHRFPVALDDAYFGTCFVHEHADEFGIDHRRLGIAGIEVGASLATGVARLAKDRRNPALGFQLLINPLFDFAPAALSGVPSLSVGAAPLEWAVAQYIDATLREDPRCSPLRANNLIGLPGALIVCAGEETMTDQAQRYAARLRTSHVAVTVACNSGAAVDFLEVPDSSESGRNALRVCSRALVEALGR